MSGGFRDSFTKDDTKEDLLGYDDTAFYYFAITVLTLVALPWTLSIIRGLIFPNRALKDFPKKNASGLKLRYCGTSAMNDKVERARAEARRCTVGIAFFWILKRAVLVVIWVSIVGTALQLGNEKEINKFDPFEILEVTPSATNPQIKRSYRKLSLLYHPDKNPDDPLAASRFIQITKAYAALTDDAARRNYEKYGNPDGPQTTKVGIGLPRFLLEKENNLYILGAFFFVIILLVPITFICYYQRTKNYAGNGIMIDTLHFLGEYTTESTRLKSCPELLAACAESRAMPTRPTDHEHVQKLAGHVVEHKKRTFTIPAVMKHQYLLWGHMQRKHQLMSPELKADLDAVLGHSMKVTQAMIEIACMREWFATAQAMIDFRRCLVQALDIRSSQLLQIPHFTERTVEQCRTDGKTPVTTLAEFLVLDSDQRKAVLRGFEPGQVADVDAFCAHIGEVEVKAQIEVDDEPDIIVGDIATVTVQMLRKHVDKDEAMGPVHAPAFPEPKVEEWWFFLVEEEASKRIVHFERCLDTGRFVEEKLRFQVTKPGVNNLTLHVLCDSYAGIDRKVELSYTAYAEEERKRELPLHEEDLALDRQPTLFQQWMGDLSHGDESEEEDEDGEGGGKPRKKEATNLAGTSKRAPEPEEEEEDSGDDSSSASEE